MEGSVPFTDLLMEGENCVLLEDIAEQESPEAYNSPASKADKRKGKNFNEDEDRLLISAWLNIGTDATVGTNQIKGSFWTRVHAYYQNNRGSFEERNQNSLSHRWKCIQVAVGRFCGCVSQIETRNQSETSIQDRLEDALKLFKAQDPKG